MVEEKTAQTTTKNTARLRILYAVLAVGVVLLVVGLIYLLK